MNSARARELHYTDSKQASMGTNKTEGLTFEGWPRWVRMRALVGLGLRSPCGSGKADTQQLQASLPFLLPDVTCSTRIVSLGQSRPLYPARAIRALLFSCPDPEVRVWSSNQ